MEIFLIMGIFSRRSRTDKKIGDLFSRLDDAKSIFAQSLHQFQTSPYSDVSKLPARSRPTAQHIQMDTNARQELSLFIESFLEKDWSEVTKLHDEMEQKWRNLILNNLIVSLRKFVPMAVNGTEQKIASLIVQGYELSPYSRAYYIQREISSRIHGVGDADFVKENEEVYKHAEYLLLQQIIELLVLNLEPKGKAWLEDASWYYATLFCEYMKWSYLEGPFKRFQ